MEGITITENTEQPARLQKSRAKLPLLIGTGVLAFLVLGYAGLCGLASSKADRILPGVTVAGISLGNLNREEAINALNAAQEGWKSNTDRSFLFAVQDGDAPPVDVRVPVSYLELDSEATAQRVWEEASSQQPLPLKGGEYLRALLGKQQVDPVYGENGGLDALLAEDLDGRIGTRCEESTVNIAGDNLEITRGKPGREANKQQIKDQLFTLMSEGKTVSEEEQTPQFTVPLEESLPKELDFDQLHTELTKQPENAVVDINAGEFKTEVVGVSFDAAAAKTAFSTLGWGEKTQVPLILTQPEVKLSDLDALLYKDLLGSCSSQISGGGNRLGNIKLAAKFCNGKILMPGQVFSYNDTVGSRTSARGFLMSTAYVNGLTVDEVGGGVCQLSSNIYLATLRANLEIVERYNHGYTVGYLPDGLDATVYFGSLDYRFRNNTKYPIKITATVSGSTLNVNIYGTKTDNKTVEMQTERIASKAFQTVYKLDASVPVGKTRTSVTPYTGRTVKAYRCVYENGTLISRTLESHNVYRSRDKVILVNPADGYKYGMGEPPAPKPNPTPTPTPTPTPNPTPTPTPTPTPDPTPTPTPDPTPTPTPDPEPTPDPTPQATE